MEKLVDDGKTRFIGTFLESNVLVVATKGLMTTSGVSNFSTPKLKRLLESSRIFPVVNQVELNPYFPQKGLVAFCQKNGIHITAYGPLGCTPVPYLIGRTGPGPLDDSTVSHEL